MGGRVRLPTYERADVFVDPRKVGQRVTDQAWLRDVGTRGWIVLMKDDAIGRRLLPHSLLRQRSHPQTVGLLHHVVPVFVPRGNSWNDDRVG